MAAALLFLVLAGCSNHWGWPIAALPYDAGWRPLPIKAWVLNEGVEAQAISICLQESCAQPGFAALLRFDGPRADAMERALGSDTATLIRAFSKPFDPVSSKSKPKPHPKTTTRIERFTNAEANGLLVEIVGAETGKRAFTAILFGRGAGRLIVALAVSSDAARARQDATASWQSR